MIISDGTVESVSLIVKIRSQNSLNFAHVVTTMLAPKTM